MSWRLDLTPAGQQYLHRLSQAGIRTVAIRGNHDALLDHTRFGPLEQGVVVLDAAQPTVRVGDAAIHGLGFETRHVAASLLPRYRPHAHLPRRRRGA